MEANFTLMAPFLEVDKEKFFLHQTQWSLKTWENMQKHMLSSNIPQRKFNQTFFFNNYLVILKNKNKINK
jgi:hypothetical protein